MATCHLCPAGDNQVPESIYAMDDHLRLLHPDVYGDGPERWPDGRIVILDKTLDPADFGEGAADAQP